MQTDYDIAIQEILEENEAIELHPALSQAVLSAGEDSIAYKIRSKQKPSSSASVVLYASAFNHVRGSEQLRIDAKEAVKKRLKSLQATWSHHELIEVR